MKALGIDIGTTTISFAVVNADDNKVQSAVTIRNDSFIENCKSWEKLQDPEKIVSKTLKKIEEILAEEKDIGIIGLTGQMHGIVYLDENGDAISPLFTWQDQRGNLPVFEENTICTVAEEMTGIKASSGYGLITHLYHARQNLVSENAKQICTIMDYLGMKLTGRKKPLVHSSNAASFGFYDVCAGMFWEKELEKLGVDVSILPEVTEDFVMMGSFQGIPVSVAIGDNQASFLGSVKEPDSSILVNMGTGGQISVLSDTYFTTGGIESRPLSRGNYLLVGSSLCGGRAYAILAEFFSLTAKAMGVEDMDPYSIMDKLMSEYTKEEPMKVTTTFSGTRENPEKRGSIENLTESNFRPDALVYGVLDGMAEELYEMYRSIEKGLTLSRTKMVASGNGLRKNKWLQDIFSRKFQMEIQMAENEEEAALGAAISAMIAADGK